jgi:cytochrome P450 family 135
VSTQTAASPAAAASDAIASSRLLPPGPCSGRLTQGTRFHRDPLGFLREARSELGDVFSLRFAIAGPMVVVADPAEAAPLFAADPGSAHTGEARRRILGMVSPHSVLGADGAEHRSARGAVVDAFRAESVDRHREAMAEIATVHAASWPTSHPFRLVPRLRALADDIFVRLIVGVREEHRARDLSEAIQRMLRVPGNPPLPPPGEGAGLLGVLGKREFDRRKRPVAELLAREIDERRQHRGPPLDLIAALVKSELTTEQIVDQLLPLLMAGQEPPACALAWLLDRFAREPAQAERFLADPPRDGLDDPFVREALRVRPAVHSSVRRLTEPRRVGGYDLPAGVVTMLPIVLLHRDPQAFPEPDAFRPERFADGPRPDAPLHPFGDGARRCLGEALARAELATVLPAVLRRLRLQPLSSGPERMVVRGTVLVPQRSGLVRARSR